MPQIQDNGTLKQSAGIEDKISITSKTRYRQVEQNTEEIQSYQAGS